jgi:hypothetical protein
MFSFRSSTTFDSVNGFLADFCVYLRLFPAGLDGVAVIVSTSLSCSLKIGSSN